MVFELRAVESGLFLFATISQDDDSCVICEIDLLNTCRASYAALTEKSFWYFVFRYSPATLFLVATSNMKCDEYRF